MYAVSETSDPSHDSGQKYDFLAGQQTTRALLKRIANGNATFYFFSGHHFWIYLVLAPCLPLDQMNCPVSLKVCRVGRDIKLGSLIGPRRPPYEGMEGLSKSN